MSVFLYNTLSRQIEELKPLKKGRVGLYTCGPTVYNYAHIGNLRTYVFEDILKRVLQYNDLKVKHVMNITDVGHLTSDADVGEDKMEKGARREGKTAWDIAAFYTVAFAHDLDALNILPPKIFCRATDHIAEQIKLVEKLKTKGFTYQTSDGIYFDTAKLPDYGKLARLKIDELKAGARVDLGEKKNPTDFALWKFSPIGSKRQMEWSSPWGMGFPGWHIECSAMAAKYLGQPFDIHCGGIDHIPVHHTNEIAQSEAAENKPLANIWMHGEFLLIGTDKMAKSGENFFTLQAVRERNISPIAYRYFLLQTHYRKQLAFSWEALQAAESGLEHLYDKARELKKTKNKSTIEDVFSQAVNGDLNIPNALAIIWEALKSNQISYKTLLKFDEVLGLRIKEAVENKKPTLAVPTAVQKLLDERATARANKNWTQSDELRAEIEALGYSVEDTPAGQKAAPIKKSA